MKLPALHLVLRSSFLVVCASHMWTEGNRSDVCQDEKIVTDLNTQSSVEGHYVEKVVIDNFLCLLYPTNLLNCSWSFLTLHKDAQLFVHISICDDETAVHSFNCSSESRVGSRSVILRQHEALYVILQFNITLHNNWTVYTYTYDMDLQEVLSPPRNITASVTDGGLLVSWGLPHSRRGSRPSCFEYQVDMGDQEMPRNVSGKLSYTEQNADPSRTYRVRMRTRKKDDCHNSRQWSEWSLAVTVEHSVYKFNILVIISISLGVPMILLAVLLFLRHQRVSKILFPPIPRPPPKYKHFLEKGDTFKLFLPAPSIEPVEEITEVEETLERHVKSNMVRTRSNLLEVTSNAALHA